MQEMEIEHYRMVDADYAIVGLRADIGHIAEDAVNTLRGNGIRTGVVVLADFDSFPVRLAHELAQAKPVGVLEYGATEGQFAESLGAEFVSAAEEPEWPSYSL